MYKNKKNIKLSTININFFLLLQQQIKFYYFNHVQLNYRHFTILINKYLGFKDTTISQNWTKQFTSHLATTCGSTCNKYIQ